MRTLNKLKHRIGDIVYMPKGSGREVHRGRHTFINASVSTRLKVGEYPEYCALVGKPRYDKVSDGWYRNPNWNNFNGFIFSYVGGWDLQSWSREVVASNGKKYGDFLLVMLSVNPDDGIMVGDYNAHFTNVQFDPEGEAGSLTYVPDTDSWLFGGTSGSLGRIFSVTDSDLRKGVSPTVVSGTPISGFSGSAGIMQYIKKTGTVICTNDTDELARSVDFGVTWHPVTVSTSGIPKCMAEDTEGNLVMGTNGGYILKSTDDGLTWAAVTETTSLTQNITRADCNPNSGKFMFVDRYKTSPIVMDDITDDVYVDTSTVFAGAIRSVCWVGGDTWFYSIDIDSFSKTKPIIYRSDDDGVTWSEITLGDTGYRVYNTEGDGLFFDGVDRLLNVSGTVDDFQFLNIKDLDYVYLNAIASEIDSMEAYVCVR